MYSKVHIFSAQGQSGKDGLTKDLESKNAALADQ